MATLTGNKVKDSYQSLLKLSTGGSTSTIKTVEDGLGVGTALKLSTTAVEVNTLKITETPTVSSSELTVLVYDDATKEVKSRELSTAAFNSGIETLSDLIDTTITTPSSGEFLKYNGTAWVNDTIPAGVSTLNALTDTTITTPSNGDLLFYNGSSWVNDSTPRAVAFVDSSNAVNFATPNSNGNILFEAGSNMTITYSGNTVSFASTTSGSSQVFANPMFVLRPNALYSVTSTLATPPQAGINNNGNASSHEVNDASNHFFPSSTTTGAVNVQQEGLVKIDVNFMLEISNGSTDVDVAVYEKPDGGSETLIQAIARGHASFGNTAIGFSLVRHVAAATDLYYKISSSNGAGLLTTSTFILTKLD